MRGPSPRGWRVRPRRGHTGARVVVPDLVRDAHTIKGSAGLLGYQSIRDVASRLEQLWRLVADGHDHDPT